MVASAESSILSRVVESSRPDLRPEVAEALLQLRFDDMDLRRMRELGQLSQDGRLTDDERSEYESYVRVGHFLALLHAKVERSLRRARSA